MALATRCPHCNALFRVAAEQLRSRSGMVRCGACRQVFNAIAGLDYLDAQRLAADDSGSSTQPAAPIAAPAATEPREDPAAASPAAAPPAPSAVPEPGTQHGPARLPGSSDHPTASFAKPEPQAPAAAYTAVPEPVINTAPTAEAEAAAPADRRRNPRSDSGTLAPRLAPDGTAAPGKFALARPAAQASAGEPGAAFDTLFVVPREEPTRSADPGGSADPEGEPQPAAADGGPSFLMEAGPGPFARGALIAGSVLLLTLLVAQIALIFRAPLVVAFPGMRPVLQALCSPLSCTASWPMRPDLLAVVSSELQAVPGTSVLELDTVLRNRAAFALALPAIELTISDNSGRAVVRKIFLPAEYLERSADAGSDAAGANIAAGGDLPVRVYFDLPGVGATNFEAYPFYP